jgi:hypothetical protein
VTGNIIEDHNTTEKKGIKITEKIKKNNVEEKAKENEDTVKILPTQASILSQDKIKNKSGAENSAEIDAGTMVQKRTVKDEKVVETIAEPVTKENIKIFSKTVKEDSSIKKQENIKSI